MRPLRLRYVAVALALLPAVAVPARAHSGDPRLRTVLDRIDPPLPAAVLVQVRSSLAAQLVVANPTGTVLTVLDQGGEPFLQVSRTGVRGNLSSPDLYTTADPGGAAARVPAAVTRARGHGPARWAVLSHGDTWGWFDHRLHPATLTPPQQARARVRLLDWQVPMLYGERPAMVRGHLEFRPVLGAFSVTVDPGPAGLEVAVLQGRLPGLFVTDPAGVAATVQGRDGEPFLRLGPAGALVNVHSRTFVEDQQARGAQAGPPSPDPLFEPSRSTSGPAYGWLDARLRYPGEDPPDAALRSRRPTVVQRWSIPADIDGRRQALTGRIIWVPSGDGLTGSGPREPRHRVGLVVAATVLAGLLSAAAAGAAVRRRRRAG